jgi:hypothetical protein
MGIIRYLIDRKIIFDNKNLKKTTIKYKNLITDLAIKDILLF